MTFDPQNDLERSLVKAATDPAHRPQFYRDLVGADVFIIQHGVKPPSGPERKVVSSGESIQIQNIEMNGKRVIPIFSSVARLQAVLSHEATYLGLNAMDFFKMTLGADLVLNPGSDFGKELPAQEIQSIVDGSIWQPSERRVTTKATQVMIGQPKNYPHELVDALKRLFAKNKKVKRAWLAHFMDPSVDQQPHTLIAVEAEGDFESVSSDIGLVARNVTIPDPPMDVIQVTGRGGLEGYFLNESKPFYERKLFGIF